MRRTAMVLLTMTLAAVNVQAQRVGVRLAPDDEARSMIKNLFTGIKIDSSVRGKAEGIVKAAIAQRDSLKSAPDYRAQFMALRGKLESDLRLLLTKEDDLKVYDRNVQKGHGRGALSIGDPPPAIGNATVSIEQQLISRTLR